MNNTALKPFAKKTFYLDLKGCSFELKLAKDLKILGGKQEAFLSKDVSFVVSNRISSKPNSASSVNSWSNCAPLSPHLYNEGFYSFMDSPTNISSPSMETNFTPVSRGMSLVQKARQKAGTNHLCIKPGTADILENCKLWNIKVYDVKKIVSWVEKYKHLYYKKYAAQLKDEQKKLKPNNQDVTRIQTPFIKVDDCKRQYRTRYKEFKFSQDMLNILKGIKEIQGQHCKRNKDCKKPKRPILKEVNNKPMQFTQPKLVRSVSASITSLCPPASNCIQASNKNQDINTNTALKRKGKDCKKKNKKKFCEICEVYFCDLDKHLATKEHEAFMKNETHYKSITDIISKFSNVPQCFGKNLDLNVLQAPLRENLPNIESNQRLNFSMKNKEKSLNCQGNEVSVQALGTAKVFEQLVKFQKTDFEGSSKYCAVNDFNCEIPAAEVFYDQKLPPAFNDVDLLCKESLNFTESESLSFNNLNEQSYFMSTINITTDVSNASYASILEDKTLNPLGILKESLQDDTNLCEPLLQNAAVTANELKSNTNDTFVCFNNSVLNKDFNFLRPNTSFNITAEMVPNKNLSGIEMLNDADSFPVSTFLKDSICLEDMVLYNDKCKQDLKNIESVQKNINGGLSSVDGKKSEGKEFDALGHYSEHLENQVFKSLGIASESVQILFSQNNNEEAFNSTNFQKEVSNMFSISEQEPKVIEKNEVGNNAAKFLSSNEKTEMGNLVLSNHSKELVFNEVSSYSESRVTSTAKVVDNYENSSQFKDNLLNDVTFQVSADNMLVKDVELQNDTLNMPVLEIELEKAENEARYADFNMPKLQEFSCELKNGNKDHIAPVINDDESDCGTELYDVNEDIVSASCSSEDTRLFYLEDKSVMLNTCNIDNRNKNTKNDIFASEERSNYNFKSFSVKKCNIFENTSFDAGNKNSLQSSPAHIEQNTHLVRCTISFNSSCLDETTENKENCSLMANDEIEKCPNDAKLSEKNIKNERNDFQSQCSSSKEQTVSSTHLISLIQDAPVEQTCIIKESVKCEIFENCSNLSNLHASEPLYEKESVNFEHDKLAMNVSEKVSHCELKKSSSKNQTVSSIKATKLFTKVGDEDSSLNQCVENEDLSELPTLSVESSFMNKVEHDRNFEICSFNSNVLHNQNLAENIKLCQKKMVNAENETCNESFDDSISLNFENNKLPNEYSLGKHAILPVTTVNSFKDVDLSRCVSKQNSICEKNDIFPCQTDGSNFINETGNNVQKNVFPLVDDSCYLSTSDVSLNLSKNLDSSKSVQTFPFSLSMSFCAKNNDTCNVIQADFNSDFEEEDEWLEIQSDIDSACKSLSEADNFAIDLSVSHKKFNDVPVL